MQDTNVVELMVFKWNIEKSILSKIYVGCNSDDSLTWRKSYEQRTFHEWQTAGRGTLVWTHDPLSAAATSLFRQTSFSSNQHNAFELFASVFYRMINVAICLPATCFFFHLYSNFSVQRAKRFLHFIVKLFVYRSPDS